MADLPGPKVRASQDPIRSRSNSSRRTFTLTSEDMIGDGRRVSMSFDPLPRVVKPGDACFSTTVSSSCSSSASQATTWNAPSAVAVATCAHAKASTCRASTSVSVPSPITTALPLSSRSRMAWTP